MSDNDNITQEQETEDQQTDTTSMSSDPSDVDAEDGDRPIIIQGGDTTNPG